MDDKTLHLEPPPRLPQNAASSTTNDPFVGRTLGTFTILRKLGAGGGGTVYLADQPTMFRQVALKVFLLETRTVDPTFFDRFQRELQALASLEHPYILPVYEWGRAEDCIYLAMRLGEQSLAAYMTKDALSLPEIVRMLDQMASALDYAHEHHIIHRDLKPANILLDGQKNCLLGDFGIVYLMGRAEPITPENMILGTPLYMAPEQALARPVSPTSDIYSLGVIIFELVCNRLPFEGSISEVLAQKMTVEAPDPREIRPDLPRTVSAAMLKALDKDPAARYQSAWAFAERFHSAVENTSVPSAGGVANRSNSSGAEGSPDTELLARSMPKAPRKNSWTRTQIIVGSLVLLAVIVLIGVFALSRRADPQAAQQHNEAGLTALQSLNYRAAIAEFEAAIRADSSMAAAYFNLGVAHEERGEPVQNDMQEALKDYREALKLDDQLLFVRYRLAELLLDQKQNDEAFGIVDTGVRIVMFGNLQVDDKTKRTFIFLLLTTRGRAYSQLGGQTNLALAMTDIQTALAVQWSDLDLYAAETYYVLANVYELQGNKDAAKQAWQKVIANSDPQNARHREWDAEARQAIGK